MMAYKRILTIQDISCLGQCSLTVALPILSALGHETCILPTAVLSTHTGGFGKPAVTHLTGMLPGILDHWKENEITFDAILVGYLGSLEAVEAAKQVMDTMLAPGGITIVDPAMADHGKRYSGLSEDYAAAMKDLCYRADIMLPNPTEAAMFAGVPYREDRTEEEDLRLLDALDHPCVVLTGAAFGPGQTGVRIRDGKRDAFYQHRKLGRNCSGTGDMFAACFTGALLQGKSKEAAVKIAADFVCRSIEKTMDQPVHWYGVKFEAALPELIRGMEE